jgi:hypothetical protein
MADLQEQYFFTVNASIAGDISASAVHASLLYLCQGTELRILDLTTPSQPHQLGTLPLPQPIEHLAIVEPWIYAATDVDVNDVSHFYLIHAPNPALPTIVATYSMPLSPSALLVHNHQVWLTDTWNGLYRLDSTPPSTIRLASAYKILAGGWGLTIDPPFTYIAAGNDGFQILDISEPSRPAFVGACALPGHINHVTVVGTLAYLAAGVDGMHIVDILDPRNPQLVGSYHDTRIQTGHVAIVGQYAFLAGYPAQIVDISNPSHPRQVGMHRWGAILTSADRSIGVRTHPDGIDIVTFNPTL